MKVIICGVGQVGMTIAHHLATEGINVTVIDISLEQAQHADESFDVKGMVGHAAHPEVLERAGARDADVLIAVTGSDEVNMVACQIAYSLFNVKQRIARIRHQGYLAPISSGLYSADQLPIDVIISPEMEVANGIQRCMNTPGSFDALPLVGGRLHLLGIHCITECNIIGRAQNNLPGYLFDNEIIVLAVIRNGQAFIPRIGMEIKPGDDVYVLTPTNHVTNATSVLGYKPEIAGNIVIIGGGNVGLNLAKSLIQETPDISLKLIELNKDRAEFVARELNNKVLVLRGNALEKELLSEANVSTADTIIAVTNDDETNIFASVLAKREGCRKAITLVNKESYAPILPVLGVDVVVSPSNITISSIMRHLRHKSVTKIHTLRQDFGEVIEAVVHKDSPLTAGKLCEIKLPEGILIGAIVHNGEIMFPTSESQIEAGDQIIAVVTYDCVHKAHVLLFGSRSNDT